MRLLLPQYVATDVLTASAVWDTCKASHKPHSPFDLNLFRPPDNDAGNNIPRCRQYAIAH